MTDDLSSEGQTFAHRGYVDELVQHGLGRIDRMAAEDTFGVLYPLRDWFEERGVSFAAVLEHAAALRTEYLREGKLPLPDRSLRESDLEVTDDAEVVTERVLEAMDEELRDVRMRLFDAPDPPFETPSEAVAWLENQGVRPERDPDSEDRRWRAFEKLRRELAKIESGSGVRMNLTVDTPVIRYRKPGEEYLHAIAARPDSPLATLEQFLRRWTDESSDLQQPELVEYVLAGTPLTIPKWRLHQRLRLGGDGWLGQVWTGEFAYSITRVEWVRAWRALAELRGKAADPITRPQRTLLALVVENVGGGQSVPKWGQIGGFWKKIAKRIEPLYQSEKIKASTSPIAVRRRWEKIPQRYKPLHLREFCRRKESDEPALDKKR